MIKSIESLYFTVFPYIINEIAIFEWETQRKIFITFFGTAIFILLKDFSSKKTEINEEMKYFEETKENKYNLKIKKMKMHLEMKFLINFS